MTAIITDKLKNIFLDTLFNQQSESDGSGNLVNRFYVAIGRGQPWDSADAAPAPIDSRREQRNFRYSMQSVKQVQAYSYVVPRRNWTANTIYQPYSDNIDKVSNPTSYSYYVINETNDVYVCVRQGVAATGLPTPSVYQPTTRGTTPETLADGYSWKYLYTISTADASSFLSANYMPVKFVDSASPTQDYYGQYQVKLAAINTPKQIVGYTVTTEGSGYSVSDVSNINTNVTPIVIKGNKTRTAKARLVRSSSGTITAVQVADSGSGLAFGAGYNKATVVIPPPTLGTRSEEHTSELQSH